MASEHYVYLWVDPLKVQEQDGKKMIQPGVFYVGKGKGKRSVEHKGKGERSVEQQPKQKQFEPDMSKQPTRVQKRIKEIESKGGVAELYYVGRNKKVDDDDVLMSEREAFMLEASLIWALRDQLVNKVDGHNFHIHSDTVMKIADKAEHAEVDTSIDSMMYYLKGLRGGTDAQGYFIDPTDEDGWENSRGWWPMADRKMKLINKLVDEGKPVALIITTGHPLGDNRRLVVDVYSVKSVRKEPRDDRKDPQAVFERHTPDEEPPEITKMRQVLKHNIPCIDDLPIAAPQQSTKDKKTGQAIRASSSWYRGPNLRTNGSAQ